MDSITNSVDMNLSKLGEIVEYRGAWHATVHGVAESQTLLSDLTITYIIHRHICTYRETYINTYTYIQSTHWKRP